MKKIMIVGAGGQIGSELTVKLRSIYGGANVVATDIKPNDTLGGDGPFAVLDALDARAYAELVARYDVDTIFNLVALLSATGERDPQLAWRVNIGALMNSLEIARENGCAVFTPSSIAAFGPDTPKDNTPQDTVMHPTTIYGVCKVTGELMSDYYYHRFGIDARSVRFPGIVSNLTLPGGGTTDYAVEIYYEAVKHKRFVCPLPEDMYMDMLYMPDALDACIGLMEADPARLVHRNSFNVTAMSFSPEVIAAEIRKHIPDFVMDYDIDPLKERIAASWPNNIDDTCARREWDWNPKWDLASMTEDMLRVVGKKIGAGKY
ncbi:MAG: NAD-dependent epimerase/dehydratase family protein [Rikenellaceae bacterium]|nr:NAD-dependent epimerase/dehydratase family protein [Rikenellaceae bacterium]MCL2692901.1 NAD-dependent epimerase/dehydratase family protein [Rikenellaceae bacterium]